MKKTRMPKRKGTGHEGRSASEPRAGRPRMPKGYRIAKGGKGLLPWKGVDERLSRSRNYWVATTRPDGRPHVMPVWGVWVDGRLCFGTDRGSRKARNLAASATVVVHLESGDDVVIVEGLAEEVARSSLLATIDGAYLRKYGLPLSGAPGDLVVYAVRPRVVFAWRERDFNKSATRWGFTDSHGSRGRHPL